MRHSLFVLIFALAGCGNKTAPSESTSGPTPEALKPTDGRRMGIARLDDEKCEAVYDDVKGKQGWLSSSKLSDALKARLGPPDGVREGGETYWLAIDQRGACNEYVADADGSIGHGSLNARECGLLDEPKVVGSSSASAGSRGPSR